MAWKLAALDKLPVALRDMVPSRAVQLMCLSGVPQSLHQQSWGMLRVPIIGITVLAEGEDDGVNGDVIHLHTPRSQFPDCCSDFRSSAFNSLHSGTCSVTKQVD